jgi:hypothetical protein
MSSILGVRRRCEICALGGCEFGSVLCFVGQFATRWVWNFRSLYRK